MVSAKEAADRVAQHVALLNAAKVVGVRHIVYTSFYGASLDSTFTLAREHAMTEAAIKERGFTYTFLRDNFYLDFFVDMALASGEIRGPAGDGRVAAVVRSDVAQVASQVMKHPQDFENQILDLTGPQALTMAELVKQLFDATGKALDYIAETIPEAYESRKKWAAEDWEYDSWVSTYTAIAEGELETVSTDIETVLGRPATSLAEYLK